MRVLGIDTALRCTGLGVVERSGPRWRAVDYGLVRNGPKLRHSECLFRLQEGVREFIARTQPDAVALEGVFFARNPNTAMLLGEARGAVMAAVTTLGLPLFEHAPRRVKQAVVGFGGAGKEQVGLMVKRLLALAEVPPPDAADALAIAICHLQAQGPVAALQDLRL